MGILIPTPRLLLREFQLEDATSLQEIANSEYVIKWMPDWAGDIERRRSWISTMMTKYASATPTQARIMLAATLRHNGQLIGMVGIGNKEEVDNEIEIAYFISRDFSGKGYMTEAAKAMSDWSIHTLNLPFLIAIVEVDNIISQKVIEKCGFKQIERRMILNAGEQEVKPFFYYRKYNFFEHETVSE